MQFGVLEKGESIKTTDQLVRLQYKNNGKLVVEKRTNLESQWEVTWSKPDGNGNEGGKAEIRINGNLVVSDADGKVVWNSGTGSQENKYSKLVLKDNGTLQIVNMNQEVTWRSNN